MNEIEHLLVCLMEECAEVQKCASKALRFGLQDVKPGGELTNAMDLEIELTDLQAIVEMLVSREVISLPAQSLALLRIKKSKVHQYMDYARERGTLNAENS